MSTTRRAFIGTGTLVGGGFVLGVSGLVLAPSRHSVVSDDGAEHGELTTWITVTPDNVVTVYDIFPLSPKLREEYRRIAGFLARHVPLASAQ